MQWTYRQLVSIISVTYKRNGVLRRRGSEAAGQSCRARQSFQVYSEHLFNTLEFRVLTGNSSVEIALFIVTRYAQSMRKTAKNRGRPRKDNALTAAERMRAYRQRKRDSGLKDVRRWEPAEGVRQYSDHRVLDARSLAMHCKIAQKISRSPDLLDKAKENLERWRAKSADPPPHYLHEWQEILKRPWPEIAEIITRMNDNSTRLRSSSPFAGVLSADEREQIYAAFRA